MITKLTDVNVSTDIQRWVQYIKKHFVIKLQMPAYQIYQSNIQNGGLRKWIFINEIEDILYKLVSLHFIRLVIEYHRCYGDFLSASREFWQTNHLVTQEGKAVLSPGCVEPGMRTANPDWG